MIADLKRWINWLIAWMCSVIYSDLGNDQWAYNGEQSSWQRKTIDNWITVLDFFWLLLLHSNICSLLTLTNWHPVTPCVPGECDACFLIHLMMRTRSQAAKKPPLPPSPSVVHWPWQTLGRERGERGERGAPHIQPIYLIALPGALLTLGWQLDWVSGSHVNVSRPL